MARPTYRIREFADLAGVTVRALHHYDRLGLLRPRRSQSGYRVYSVGDLELLEQIVALKFIGLPLNRIKHLLRRNRADLCAALRAQRGQDGQPARATLRDMQPLAGATAMPPAPVNPDWKAWLLGALLVGGALLGAGGAFSLLNQPGRA